MNSEPTLTDDDLRKSLRTLFKVVYGNLSQVQQFLRRQKEQVPSTSYEFISANIAQTIGYAERQIQTILEKAESMETDALQSPLLLSYHRVPAPNNMYFKFRNTVTKNSEDIRQLVMNLTTNINSTFPAYIFIYEVLEKFKFKTPFVLLESTKDEFSVQRVVYRFFQEYKAIEPKIVDAHIETIEYSGNELEFPQSLLLFGHEAFHIIEKYSPHSKIPQQGRFFSEVCRKAGIKLTGEAADRCLEGFIDAMAALYFGPAYVVALRDWFERIHPISGKKHAEIPSRLYLLSRLWKEERYESAGMTATDLLESRDSFRVFMKTKDRVAEIEDERNLDLLLEGHMIGYIVDYFKTCGDDQPIRSFYDFHSHWLNKEVPEGIDLMDEAKIVYCLRNFIPVAVRPTILLDTLVKCRDSLPQVEERGRRQRSEKGNESTAAERLRDTVVASIKKWYVSRYYHQPTAAQNATEIEAR